MWLVNNYKFMKFTKNKFVFLILLFVFLFVPILSMARESSYGLTRTVGRGNLPSVFNESSGGLIDRLGGTVGFLLSFVGLIFLGLMVYSGIMWMTASGNDQQIDKSKKTMIWAVIGIICIFASFALVQFIGEQSTKSVFTEEDTIGGTTGTTVEQINSEEELDLADWEQEYLEMCINDGEYVYVNNNTSEEYFDDYEDGWSGFGDDGNMDWGDNTSEPSQYFIQFSQDLCLCFLGKMGGRNCGRVLCEHESKIDKLQGGSGIDCLTLYGE